MGFWLKGERERRGEGMGGRVGDGGWGMGDGVGVVG